MGLLGAGLGSALGGLLGGASAGSAPTQQTVETDPETKRMIAEQSKQALGTSAEDIQKKFGAGIPQAQAQMNPELAMSREQAMGGGPSGSMAGAIEKKYQSALGNKLSHFDTMNRLSSITDKQQRLASAAQIENESANISARAQHAQVMAQINAERARSQVLQSVLGIGGRMIGVAAGGGFKSPTENMPTATPEEASQF